MFPRSRSASTTRRGRQLRGYVRRIGERPFSPFDSATILGSDLLGLCRGWPNAAPAPVSAGPLPNVPTLVLTGTADLRTPLEDANRLRTLIPAAQIVAVPFTGHSVMTSELSSEHCAARALERFVASQPIAGCAESTNPYPPTPVPPRRLQSLRGVGSGDTVGKTIAAVLRTLSDQRRQVVGDLLEIGRLPARAGGLRGGYVTIDPASELLHLRGVVFVPGVSVSGVVPLKAGRAAEHLTVRGQSAANGTITVDGPHITGRLGGRAVDIATLATAARRGEPSLRALRRSVRLRRAG
ncbi:MAG: hypothetical protein QOJ89_4394 [bacterium]